MTAACTDSGLLPPVLEEIGARLRVTLYSTPNQATLVDDEIDTAILAQLADGEGRSTSEIAVTIGRTPRSTRRRLVRLVARGLVAEIGSRPNDPIRR